MHVRAARRNVHGCAVGGCVLGSAFVSPHGITDGSNRRRHERPEDLLRVLFL